MIHGNDFGEVLCNVVFVPMNVSTYMSIHRNVRGYEYVYIYRERERLMYRQTSNHVRFIGTTHTEIDFDCIDTCVEYQTACF